MLLNKSPLGWYLIQRDKKHYFYKTKQIITCLTITCPIMSSSLGTKFCSCTNLYLFLQKILICAITGFVDKGFSFVFSSQMFWKTMLRKSNNIPCLTMFTTSKKQCAEGCPPCMAIPHGLTYLFEVLLWKFILLQTCVGWIKLRIYSPTNFPSLLGNIFLTVTENNFLPETTVSQVQPTFICWNSAITTVKYSTKYVQS